MKKAILNAKLFFDGLFHGMKAADDMITTNNKELEASNEVLEQKMESNSLFSALMRGEITQEVKDVRYEMYESVRKSGDFEVLGYSGKAVKKNKLLIKQPKNIYTDDGLKVILIQDNKLDMNGAYNAVDNFEKVKEIRVEADAEHTFKATHEYRVRHKVESFTRKVVVKATGEENKFKLDLYLPEYPLENDPRAIYASKELESLYKSGSRTSDLTDLKTLTFTTDGAYGDEDWKIYDFTITQYIGIMKYDGSYILSFYASLPESGVFDVTDEFNDEESMRKFNEKEGRENYKGASLLEVIAIQEFRENNKIDEKKANELLDKVKKNKKKE